MSYEILTQKKLLLDSYKPLDPELVRNLEEWFRVELTFTSNALEGNTLTRRETAVILDQGLAVGGKSLREHLEATNHAKAIDFIRSLIQNSHSSLEEDNILHIHRLILSGIDDENAGYYRNVSVRISGSSVILPNPRKVPDLMKDFMNWLQKGSAHPVAKAIEAHYRFVTIHPFIDGNGRTGRLLMNALLMMHGYPSAIIRKKDRLDYIGSLEQSQLGGAYSKYEKLMQSAINRSLDIYINSIQGHSENEDLDTSLDLLKIGVLAKKACIPISTIRHWTKEGLLTPESMTPSGYHLFSSDTLSRCQRISELQKERYSLEDIKRLLGA